MIGFVSICVSGNAAFKDMINVAPRKSLEKSSKIFKYFKKKKIPLADYSMQFVTTAKDKRLPYSLLPAIAAEYFFLNGGVIKNNNPFDKKNKYKNINQAIYTFASNFKENRKFKDHNFKGKALLEKLTLFFNDQKTAEEAICIMEKIQNTN